MSSTFSIYIVKQYNAMSNSNFNDNLLQFENIDDIVEELESAILLFIIYT